jgi:hypothetical protein
MKSKFPNGYVNAIRFQTQNMTETRVVVLQNISEAMMFYLQPHICAIPGIRDLVASPHVDENGRHTLLEEKASFKSIRNILTQNLAGWIATHVSSDAQPVDEQFSGVARVKPIFDDGMSSGENSWMSSSNVSFVSLDISVVRNDDYFTSSTNIDNVFTYADVTMPFRNPYQATTAPTEDCTTAVTSDITELEAHQKIELEKMAETHRLAVEASAKIVAEQRAEIAQLKSQRQEDLALRAQELLQAQAKLDAQDEATSELRQESTQTKEDISALRNEMKDLMNSFKAAFPHPRTPPTSENKRAADTHGNDDNSQSEKRQDVRSTPGKKLFHDKMDLDDPTPPQQKLTDGGNSEPLK